MLHGADVNRALFDRPIFSLIGAAAAGLVAFTPVSAQHTAASTGQAWQLTALPQSSLVYSRDGTLIGEIGRQFRTNASIKSLPDYVWGAFVAIEDRRFFEHDGVDLKGLGAAAINDVLKGEHRGASTIEEQLVGNLHPDLVNRSSRSIGRKWDGEQAAREMDRHYTKWQILEEYINAIDLGHNWFGVEAGARHYFGRTAAQMTIAQAATLAALPKSPTIYDPIRHPDRALARRNVVIAAMANQGKISSADSAHAVAQPLGIVATDAVPSGYFVDAVRQHAARAGYAVMNGGYRIYTTLDTALQRDAVNAVVQGLRRAEMDKNYKHRTMAEALRIHSSDYLEAAAVAIDPSTGDVKALVGGRDYARAPFNRAVNGLRQPGSSFKPIVYAAALADGVPANAIVPDTSLEIPLITGGTYTPHEDDDQFWGTVAYSNGKPIGALTIREGLIHSRNAVAVQLGVQVGMDSVAALAERLGIGTRIDPVPASAIGASAVHPINMAAAYTAFANNGAVVQPRLIVRITTLTGSTVYARQSSTPQQVIDPRVAFIVRDMMRDVAEHGTGTEARAALPDNVPMAGKTGTSNDNKDLWFVGMTPDIVAAVWVGFDRAKTVARGAVGGSFAAPIWGAMLGKYYQTHTTAGWPPTPDGLVIAELDRDTGQLATPSTAPAKRYAEYFIPGTEPAALRDIPWVVPQWGPLFVPASPPSLKTNAQIHASAPH
jgi:penicillin-binding protein 1A